MEVPFIVPEFHFKMGRWGNAGNTTSVTMDKGQQFFIELQKLYNYTELYRKTMGLVIIF